MTRSVLEHETSIDTPVIRDTWLIVLPLWLYAVLWLLGISNFIWPFVVVFIALRLLISRPTRVPAGYGIWLLFLGWLALSFTQLDDINSALVSGYRASMYLAAAVLFLYAYNLPHTRRHTRSVVTGVAAYWATLILFGLAALAVPETTFLSGLELVLPHTLRTIDFVQELIHPRMAQIQSFLGNSSPRPAAPFFYTNTWGSAVGLFAPIYLYWVNTLSGRRRIVAATLAIVALLPIVASLNRGLWISLFVAGLYASLRHALQGRVRPLLSVMGLGLLVTFILLATPLSNLILERSETGHSDHARTVLYESAIEATLTSPLTGHGTGVPIVGREAYAPAGSHGEIWALMVTRGMPAAITFIGFVGYCLVATWRHPVDSIGFWTHIILVVCLVQMFVYSLTPSVPIILTLLGLSLRRVGDSDAAFQARE